MAQPVITNEDRARVSQAVGTAETASAGEIVTIIAERSDGYLDVALAWAALAAFSALTVLAIAPDFYLGLYDRLTGGWTSDHSPRALFALAAAIGILKFIGTLAVQLWQPLKFLLIPGRVKSLRVRDRAVTCFKVGAERRTHGRTGVLIYLSLRERRAEIVADEAIAGMVSPDVWGAAMAAMLAHIREGRIADGMIAAVEQAGTVLAEHFPRDAHDVNELPDRLIEV